EPLQESSWNDSHLEILGTGEVRARVWNSAVVSLGTVSFGTWHQAVLRYDRTGLALDGFLDGVRSTTRLTGVDRQAPWEFGVTTFYYALGSSDITNLGSGAYFKGQMDEFRVWNIALSDAQIQANRNRRLTGTENGLVLYWKADELSGGLVIDSTANARHGRLGGSGFQATQFSPNRSAGVLGPVDQDGDPITVSGNGVTGVAVSVSANRILLTVDPAFTGTASLTFTAEDGPRRPG